MRGIRIRGVLTSAFTMAVTAACTSSTSPEHTSTAPPPATAPPGIVSAIPEPATHPRGTRSGIAEVDAVLSAIDGGDQDRLGGLLQFSDIRCRHVIRDAGDLPACPDGVADGTLISVFPESFCEGSYVYEGDEPAAFDALKASSLFAVYHGSEFGRGSDFAVVLSGGGGIWWIKDGKIDRISHGCGADVRTQVASNGLTRAIVAPVDSGSCGPADATQRTFGDMDGDGTLDPVYLDSGSGDPHLGACWAAGSAEVSVGGMATAILRVFNAVGDDGAEIFYGDSTATSFIVQVAQVAGGRLVSVSEGPRQLSFEVSREREDGGAVTGHGMECTDIDGDGAPELVEVSYVRTGDSVAWTRVPLAIADGVATRGRPITGILTVGVDDEEIERMHAAICHGAVLFSASRTQP